VGCILAELLQRKPLFQGRDYIDQLKLIIRTLGSPSEEDLAFISSSRARAYIRALQASEARAARPRCMSAALQCTHTHSFHLTRNLSLFLVLSQCTDRARVHFLRGCAVSPAPSSPAVRARHADGADTVCPGRRSAGRAR